MNFIFGLRGRGRSNMALIEVENLAKDYKVNIRKKGLMGAVQGLLIPEYKVKKAVQQVSFSIEKGEMVGFVGPNGAGKSTTVKMLTGILYPTSGKISIKGLSPQKDRKENAFNIGVVFGQRTQMWWDLPIIDTYELLKYVYRIPEKVYQENLVTFSELLDLKDFLHIPVRQLSLGQRMRGDIAAALLHNPEIIFFDEPTIGLDIVAKEKIREFIKYINKERNATMLFTTHDMGDIEKVCNRMIIIDKGSLIYDGSLEAIKQKYGKSRTLIVEFAETYADIRIDGVETINGEGNKKFFRFDKEQIQISSLIGDLTNRYNILDLTVQETDIESIIREIYGGGVHLDKIVC